MGWILSHLLIYIRQRGIMIDKVNYFRGIFRWDRLFLIILAAYLTSSNGRSTYNVYVKKI